MPNISTTILELAKRLTQDKTTFTRSELAYELKKFGVNDDTIEVGRLVWEAFEAFGHDERIRTAFVNNQGNRSVVDEQEVTQLLDSGNTAGALQAAQDLASCTSEALTQLSTELSDTLNQLANKYGTSVEDVVKGTAGVIAVQNQARGMVEGYTQLVNGYEAARCRINELTTSYIDIRSRIEQIYRRYTTALTDIYGDAIRTVEPDLFDFNTIQWLDTQSMISQVKLEYTDMTANCTELLSQISDSFQTALQTAAISYRTLDSKQAGIVMAGISIIRHYLNAGTKTAAMKQSLLTLNKHINNDAKAIETDMVRLLEIFKTINDIFLPQAETFCRHADQILNDDLDALIDKVYSTPEARELRRQRDEILAEIRLRERAIVDTQIDIDYYESHLAECETLLNGICGTYFQAIKEKPSKPGVIKNFFTLGNARKDYNRAVYDWTQERAPILRQYEDLRIDISQDHEDLASKRKQLTAYRNRLAELQPQYERLSQKLLDMISANDELRSAVAEHLTDMVGLLRIGKNLLNNGLDERLVQATEVESAEKDSTVALPDPIKHAIELLKRRYEKKCIGADDIEYEHVETPATADNAEVSDAQNALVKDTDSSTALNTEHEKPFLINGKFTKTPSLSKEGGLLVLLGLDYLRTKADTEAMEAKDAEQAEERERHLEALKNEFQQRISAIDDRANVLLEVMTRINTAEGHDAKVAALKELAAPTEPDFTPEDWDEFFAGRKTIEI